MPTHSFFYRLRVAATIWFWAIVIAVTITIALPTLLWSILK